MKKITVLSLTLAFSLGFVGCSSDDEGGISAAKLQGKWNHETYKQTVDGEIFIEEEPYSGNDSDCAKDYIQFNEDGSAILGDFDFDCNSLSTNTSWSLNGKTVVLMMDGEVVEYKVTSISDTQMTVTQTESDFGITSVVTYTFSKAN